MYWYFPEKRKDKKKLSLLIFRENLTSEFDSACLNPAMVHFPIGGMDGEAEAYDDDGDCNGLDGGGERRLRGLGEGVAGLVGLRPRAEAWGSAVEPGRGGSALEPAEGGALEPEA